MHLSSILFLALPLKIVFLSSLLSPSLSPVPLYMTKTQERKNKRGMEALFLSSPVAMTKEKSIGDKEGN